MECLLAAGVKRELNVNTGDAFQQLQPFINKSDGWLFGHLGYDLKNETEKISSAHPDGIQFPDLFFFEPEIILRLNEKEIVIEADDPEKVFDDINSSALPSLYPLSVKEELSTTPVIISNRIQKDEYLSIIRRLQQHILRGDCYEINFCQEFFAHHTVIDPVAVYKKLSNISPNPFSINCSKSCSRADVGKAIIFVS